MRKVPKKQFFSNETSLESSRKIKKKIFLNSTQLTEQHGLCSYPGVFSLSHRVIKKIKYFSLENYIY